MTHPVLTPTSPTKAAHRSPWHRMPFRLSSTSSRGMRLSSSSFSIVNRGQSLEYEQQAPQELQAPIGRRLWDLCGAILSTEGPSLADRSRWTKSPQLSLSNGDARLALWCPRGAIFGIAHANRNCGGFFRAFVPPSG